MLARQKDDAWSLSSPFASGCSSLAGSASMSMSRAIIASAYIRQLRSGLPLCCMHGRSRRKDGAHLWHGRLAGPGLRIPI